MPGWTQSKCTKDHRVGFKILWFGETWGPRALRQYRGDKRVLRHHRDRGARLRGWKDSGDRV